MSTTCFSWPGLESCGLLARGPGPEAGPVPTVIALALSASMTLAGGPIARPAEQLAARGIRVLSLDLPFHQPGVDPQQALGEWATSLQRGIHPFASWLDLLEVSLEQLFEEGVLGPLSFYGISRGALVAAWSVAHAKFPPGVHVEKLCGWAPLVRLSRCLDFQSIKDLPTVQEMDCCHWVEAMRAMALKVWIGNLDQRVGVAPSLEWVEALAHAQKAAGQRICRSELVVRPSIGASGHGTPPESFDEGVQWLIQPL